MLTIRVACEKGNVSWSAIANNVPGPGPSRRACGAYGLPQISSLWEPWFFTTPYFSIKASIRNLYRLDSFSTPTHHDKPGRTNFIIIAFQIINISAKQKTVNNLYYLFYTAGMALAIIRIKEAPDTYW